MTEKLATLQEIETHYSLDDVLDANEALDVMEEAKLIAEERAAEQARRK